MMPPQLSLHRVDTLWIIHFQASMLRVRLKYLSTIHGVLRGGVDSYSQELCITVVLKHISGVLKKLLFRRGVRVHGVSASLGNPHGEGAGIDTVPVAGRVKVWVIN